MASNLSPDATISEILTLHLWKTQDAATLSSCALASPIWAHLIRALRFHSVDLRTNPRLRSFQTNFGGISLCLAHIHALDLLCAPDPPIPGDFPIKAISLGDEALVRNPIPSLVTPLPMWICGTLPRAVALEALRLRCLAWTVLQPRLPAFWSVTNLRLDSSVFDATTTFHSVVVAFPNAQYLRLDDCVVSDASIEGGTELTQLSLRSLTLGGEDLEYTIECLMGDHPRQTLHFDSLRIRELRMDNIAAPAVESVHHMLVALGTTLEEMTLDCVHGEELTEVLRKHPIPTPSNTALRKLTLNITIRNDIDPREGELKLPWVALVVRDLLFPGVTELALCIDVEEMFESLDVISRDDWDDIDRHLLYGTQHGLSSLLARVWGDGREWEETDQEYWENELGERLPLVSQKGLLEIARM